MSSETLAKELLARLGPAGTTPILDRHKGQVKPRRQRLRELPDPDYAEGQWSKLLTRAFQTLWPERRSQTGALLCRRFNRGVKYAG
jgi:hypothetical protein